MHSATTHIQIHTHSTYCTKC